MDRKIKLLCYMDSPSCATGFGTVSRNICDILYKTGRYDIEILGINYWGDPHDFPYKIWPVGTNAERDPYGRKKVCNMISSGQLSFDLLFFLQDTFILDFVPELTDYLKRSGKSFKSLVYFPVDGKPKESWVKNISVADYLIAYSKFGCDEVKKISPTIKSMEVIPHGVNVEDYFPIAQDTVMNFRAQYFGKHKDKFIITNLNRNQQRKDIPRTIKAFSEFKKLVPNSILYLHMAMQDQGWNLPEVCNSFGLSIKEDVIFPERFGPNQGYPRQIVNLIYNASDVVVSTSLGEGFGLSFVESMATLTPVIMPANTALIENITEDRGYLVKSGTNNSLFTILPNDNEVIRPLVDVDDLVDKLLQVYRDPKEAQMRAMNAYKWVTSELNWQNGPISKKWITLFDKAYEDHLKDKNGYVTEVVDKENVISTERF